jgi:hypothetical protein
MFICEELKGDLSSVTRFHKLAAKMFLLTIFYYSIDSTFYVQLNVSFVHLLLSMPFDILKKMWKKSRNPSVMLADNSIEYEINFFRIKFVL